jgi:hypothetical protein
VLDSETKFTINYFVPYTDLLGRVKADAPKERRVEEYECAEA